LLSTEDDVFTAAVAVAGAVVLLQGDGEWPPICVVPFDSPATLDFVADRSAEQSVAAWHRLPSTRTDALRFLLARASSCFALIGIFSPAARATPLPCDLQDVTSHLAVVFVDSVQLDDLDVVP